MTAAGWDFHARPAQPPTNVLDEALQADTRLLWQLLEEQLLTVPEWRDDGSGPTAQWLARPGLRAPDDNDPTYIPIRSDDA